MMAYQEGIVASIYVNDKPVREFNFKGQRTCKIPFGSEYQIFIKNKSSSRGLVSIDIDGTDVLGFKQFIMRPHDQLMLERFVDELDSGKKFKFISLKEGMTTGEIQDPTNKDNGLITIKFYKEIPPPHYTSTISLRGSGATNAIQCSNAPITTASATTKDVPFSYTGATVEGETSNQKFSYDSSWFETELVPIELSIKLIGIPLREKFGVFLDSNKKPTYEFEDRIEAFRFVELNDFGSAKVKIREV